MKNKHIKSKDANGEYSKISKISLMIKRAFPYFAFELVLAIVVIAMIGFAIFAKHTATIGQEILIMQDIGEADVENVDVTEPTFESEFEISGEIVENTQTIEYKTKQMCFIGDSRTVGMQYAVLTDAHFIAEVSVGLTWFNESATSLFKEAGDDTEICVVALGVNDLGNMASYIVQLNEFAEQYPDKRFVYVNVGPVDETKTDGVSNASIEAFNNGMSQGLSARWEVVDLYNYLVSDGFESDDGLHYSSKDCGKIFAWIVDNIKIQIVSSGN